MSDYQLFLASTTNGRKITVLVELLNIQSKVEIITIDLAKKQQKEDWFLKINPNGKIPALASKDSSNPFYLSESNAILQFLVSKYDTENKFSYPVNSNNYFKTLELSLFQVSALAPVQGKIFGVIRNLLHLSESDVNDLYTEIKRVYQVLEDILKSNNTGFLVGDKLTIAEVFVLPWIEKAAFSKIDLTQFPLLNDLLKRSLQVPEIAKGLAY
ncbi:glutathione S-transferase family protein [Ascoidea rubescens DSM 1968]|uniref:Glutathione S-transferase n=1 Tax=Ascoidea rubescens DSM 1968 TaxID=1344418 RepID=A0A1D2VR59_9ASCO|nr:glutathione S-transferase [Ascoidea rubescens DSM 1968]ODV64103.1 glutathione S-transferase [Ascoidea rubescens DSM 1968]